ncbi:MAG: hypothetical protein FJW23_01690 [Acidimicrobiia bacterium]|nr:hypothetical protein [Acidimicrobiia bacterium]
MTERCIRPTGGAVLGVLLALGAGAAGCAPSPESQPEPEAAAPQEDGVPVFEVDPTWPKQPFPDQWIMGGAMGVDVDANDHIWVSHLASDLTQFETGAAADPPRAICCRPAPPIIEFDQDGNIVRAWGGPGEGYQWPRSVHGLTVDYRGNVWVGGNVAPDAHVLKFAPDGRFLLQIGRSGESRGNADTANLGSPADVAIDPDTNEVWVADGYRNRRVIAYDADTGEYKRHFGAYGEPPPDTPPAPPGGGPPPAAQDGPPKRFGLVHCVVISNDDLVYVCDRVFDRIQVFRTDGTYVTERVITPDVVGAVANDVSFSPDPEQRFMYVTDHASSKVWILRRETMEVVGSFGYGGHFVGGFTITHNIATDSKGNLYVTEGLEGKRVQRFLYKGMGPATAQ